MPFLPGSLARASVEAIEQALACPFVPMLAPSEGKLSSRYGMRMGRTSGTPTYHAGMDFAVHPDLWDAIRAGERPYPTVFACRSGIVEVIGRDEDERGPFNGYGNCVAVKHFESWEGHEPIWTFAAHLSTLDVEEGQTVAAGEPLGRVGNTSNRKFRGMGPHLHFELRKPRPGGESPYPGRYRVYNMDPEPWLASWGLTFDRRGRFVLDYDKACRRRD